MYPTNIELPSVKSVAATAASVAATAMLVRSYVKNSIPYEIKQYFYVKFKHMLTTFTNEITLVIEEFDGLKQNRLFHAAEIYVGTIISPSTKRFRALLPDKEQKIHLSVVGDGDITDQFCGFQLKWKMVTGQTQKRHHRDDFHSSTVTSEVRYLELTFHKRHKRKVTDEYLPYVLERSEAVKQENKTPKLHTLKKDRMYGSGMWQSVNLDHPANFDTLAMDDEIKNMITDDLDRFLKRRSYYRKVGKAWKRGYLLFGPPGTGKSSLIAAIANYLKFDVYDLELTDLRSNSDWRKLLISMGNRSILVVEDIDASVDLTKRKKAATTPDPPYYGFQHDQGPKVTLSGLLNFMDGLWTSCGDERIIIFTTNHKDHLDPALLRPGRMDVHIHMSYCTPCGFRMLATNYLGDTGHPLVLVAEQLIASTKVTPAEVGEQLLRSDDPGVALQGLIQFIEHKKEIESVGEENLEVTKIVAPQLERKEEMSMVVNAINAPDGLKELLKRAKASPAGMSKKILKKNEAVDALKALKILIGFLEEEIGSEATLQESGKEDGIKIQG